MSKRLRLIAHRTIYLNQIVINQLVTLELVAGRDSEFYTPEFS